MSNYILDLFREGERKQQSVNRTIPKLLITDSYKTDHSVFSSDTNTPMYIFKHTDCRVESAIAPRKEIDLIIKEDIKQSKKDKVLVVDNRKYSINIISALQKDNIKTIVFLSEGLLWHWKTNEPLKCGDIIPADMDRGKILNNLLSAMLDANFINYDF